MSGEPTVISTFAGCGGSSLGYKWAGYKELLAIEWDTNAVETFKLNFPDVPVWQRDIKEVTGKEILEFTGLKEGELDVLDGSPPCQGFSTAGKRKVLDPRNDLFKEYVRLIDELKPKVFVMENVSGMVKGKMKGRFIEIMKCLKDTGYNVKCKLMNAMYYGVPQSRQRLIFIGSRKDNVSFPNISGKPLSIKMVLQNCPTGIIHKGFNDKRLKLIKQIKPWGDGSDIVKDSYFNLKRLDWTKPSRTITKVCGLIHPDEHRYLTIPELKRLQSFPDNFSFIGQFEQQWARIGNSVPPKFMQAIASHIKEMMLSN